MGDERSPPRLRVSEAQSGIFRRVKVVEFPTMPEEDRDPEIKNLIAGEGPGILNWALEGLERLRKRGHFDIPESVRSATREFKSQTTYRQCSSKRPASVSPTPAYRPGSFTRNTSSGVRRTDITPCPQPASLPSGKGLASRSGPAAVKGITTA